jgi:hypothetical protein
MKINLGGTTLHERIATSCEEVRSVQVGVAYATKYRRYSASGSSAS